MKSKIDLKKIPSHVAVIMDGNRRWARQHGLKVQAGHRAGAENLERIVNYCRKIGIKHFTVYALSTENWRSRSMVEVKNIFNLFVQACRDKEKEYRRDGIKLFVLGNFQALPLKVKNAVKKVLNIVLDKKEMSFNVALNYGGRDEIVTAIRKIVKDKIPPSKINEKLVSHYLYTQGQPDPDLIIRTGGEFRLSNFLLWQMSYAELYFTDVLWPDFNEKEMEKALIWYQNRERRKGK